ncbi:uncharacterized protein LOC106873884 [Octopus bimaculoides]|uniref:MARVEL domain-containing protein n=1 Tax=Octopus bimaculoides TaxID=37653 RepID=A0A0L8GZ04_OCTBM|nr:uncharacterized protein LOC106873884 [Octopus bimaculoides]|eukprot:XP_014776894.1 PREDICTED: uncharacterized protein LOC106873884 [Octopus bimaculoides]
MAGLHLEKLSLAPNILRLFIVVCSLIPFALVSSWSSNGVTYYDFNAKDFNHVHSFEFYIVVSVVTFVSGVITCIIVLLDLKIMPCIVDITVSIVLMVFWVVSDSLLVTSLSNLSETVAVKEARLDFSQIEGAIAVGFLCAVLLFGFVWFTFCSHRREQERGEPSITGRSPLVTDIPIDILS